MDLISIILPYYKKKKYIQKTIESVINQTYQNFELILIYDDVDQSDLEFLMKISRADKRIRVILNKKNLGAGYSRNKAIKLSKGRYIAFIDADDLWHKKKLELQLKIMKKNKFHISHCSYEIIDKKGNFLTTRKARNFTTYESLLKSCDIGLSSVILKKNILNKDLKFPNLQTKEDFVLWLKLLKKKYKIMAIDKKLVKWRKLDNSLSTSTFQKLSDGLKVYNVYMEYNFLTSMYLLFCLSINFLRKNG
tara:strand:- start:4388 stop:5134 length:747 start_codon:yes stop_codon:yes gene_type:complete